MDDLGCKDNIVIKMVKRSSECVIMKFLCHKLLMELNIYKSYIYMYKYIHIYWITIRDHMLPFAADYSANFWMGTSPDWCNFPWIV